MTAAGKCPFDLKEINSNPEAHAAYAAARERGGTVFRTDDLGGYVAVLGFEEVRAAAADHAGLCSGQGATIPPLGTARAIPTEIDLPAHKNYRRLLQPELRPDRVKDWEQRMVEIVDEVLDEVIEEGRGDLRAVAERLPAFLIAEILGVPSRAAEMLEMTDRLNRAAGSQAEDALESKQAFASFINELVTTAKNDPNAEGLLGFITRAEIDGKQLTHDELVRMGISLVVAGHETTVNGIGSLLWLLGTHADVKQRLIESPDLIPRAVDEALRLEAPVTVMGRTATHSVKVGDLVVEEGEKVGLLFGAANLDPARFPDPGKFDIDRDAKSHLAFGHGIHRCVGEHLAKLEMRVVAERVLARIPDYRIDGTVQVGANIAMNRGVMAIPVSFTPGTKVGSMETARPGAR